MNDLFSVSGFYGSGHTPCEILVYNSRPGLYWYCVEGSQNVNATYDRLIDGIDVETVYDVDTFTASQAVDSLSTLEIEVDN